MDKDKFMLWLVFENSGQINDYLKYKFLERIDMEAGEDFGSGKNHGSGTANNKIR